MAIMAPAHRPVTFGNATLWNCIISNGDGSASALTFRNKPDAQEFGDLYFNQYGDAMPEVEQVTIYDNVAAAADAHGLDYEA